ncbi:MAG: MerR family transcriptional regulator, partial [Acidobacteriota bacterium]|nr:MerR family transcriptional regulator [Acidobacteriota bacterium]
MLTVSKLASACGVSRTTILYYESIGLLRPARRGAGKYRVFSEGEAARLRQIRAWRDAGLSLADIRAIVRRPESDMGAILTRRLAGLDVEI